MIAATLAAAVQLVVPFVAQEKDTCGAASLAMVLAYWGSPVPHDEVVAATVEPGERGIAGSRLTAFARERGFFALAYEGDRAQLRETLEKGRPLVVALAAARGRSHDVVVTGFDDEKAEVVLHDPSEGRNRRMAEKTFLKRWAESGHWSLLVLPRP